ncbi:MAG: hypothetical protein GF401_06245 [Chitinivibrionales bacterium]|nr:hypothetical protein [Chitinivibrionales bacterium]
MALNLEKLSLSAFRIFFLLGVSFSLLWGVEPRESFDIPLAKLSVAKDEVSGQFEKVRITYSGDQDVWTISRIDDTYSKHTRHGIKKEIYKERGQKSYIISDFEAEQLDKVCKTFIKTLNGLEKDLQRERWGKCLYLDAYFPRFLKGFYYLVCAARNSQGALPPVAQIPDELFDVSLRSPKSDARIGKWRANPEYIIRLRIIIKELIYQTKQWQKKELTNSRRNREIAYSEKFEVAYAIFIRLYFNLKPPPKFPKRGKHL